MTIKVTPIGSCRIHNPLKKCIAKSQGQLNTADIYGFTHTSAEALQQLKYLQGEYLPSESIRPILSSRLRFNKTKLNQATSPSDLYFVEISSAKTLKVGDEYVQMNYIHVYFSDFFIDPQRSKKFWSLAARSDREEFLEFLNNLPVFAAYPKEKKELLSNIFVKQSSEEELRKDMMEIVQRVNQVVFVTHCNVSLPDMTTISSREHWIQNIEKVANDLGYKLYNPTALMLELGQSLSLEKNGLDSTHYTPLFEQKIFNDLQRLYIEPLCQEAVYEREPAADASFPLEKLNQLEALYHQGEISGALQQLNDLLRKHPKHTRAKEFMGRLLYRINDYERAILYFTELDLNHELTNEGRMTLVKAYFKIKQYQDVLNHADLLFEEEINEPDIIKLTAMASQALGNVNKASIYWEQLYKFEQFKFEAASQQALLFEQSNDLDSALFWINRALKLKPMDLALRALLNKMLPRLADENSLELLIDKINPVSEEEYIAIAKTALEHQLILTAAKSLVKANRLWPNNSNVKKMLRQTADQWLKALQLESNEINSSCLQYLKAILLIQPRQITMIRLRREYIIEQRAKLKAAYKKAEYDKAIAAGMNIYFLDPEFAGVALILGRSFYAKALYSEAMEWFTKATDLNPEDKNAWILTLRAALKANKPMEALSSIQRIPLVLLSEEGKVSDMKHSIQQVIKESLKEMAKMLEKEELDYCWQLNTALEAVSPLDKKVLKARQLLLKKMHEQLRDAESSEIQIKLAKLLYEKDPNNIQALRIIAVSLMRQKKLEESLSYWEKLCILSPDVNSYKMQAQKCIHLEESQAAHTA